MSMSEEDLLLQSMLTELEVKFYKRSTVVSHQFKENRVFETIVPTSFDQACIVSVTGYKSKLRYEPARSMRCLDCGNKFYDKTSTRDRIVQLACPYCFKSHYEDYVLQKKDEEYFDYGS